MGGIHDPERGAMLYERRIEVKVEETETGEKKRVRKIVEQTSRIGLDQQKKKKTPEVFDDEDDEPKPPKPEEKNPLYSAKEYVSDFTNPLYTGHAPRESSAVLGTESVELDDQIPIVTDADMEVGMEEADTLF